MDCDRECDSNRNKPDPKTNLTDDVTLNLASVPELKLECEGKGPASSTDGMVTQANDSVK